MSGQCAQVKANGERCRLAALEQRDVCWAHAPENADRRRRTASRGGRGVTNDVRDLKQEVRDLIAGVKAGEQDRSDAAVMLQGYRVLKDYIELERKGQDLDDLLERLGRLENARRAG